MYEAHRDALRIVSDLFGRSDEASRFSTCRSTALAEMAQSKLPHAVSEEKARDTVATAQATGEATAPLFFDRAHDA